MNLIELSSLLLDEKLAEEYLREKGILKTFTQCDKCDSEKIGRVRRGNYKCYGCKREWSPKKNSILFHYNISYSKFIGLIKLFELDLTARQASAELNIDVRKTGRIFTLFREAIAGRCLSQLSYEYFENESPLFSITFKDNHVDIHLERTETYSTDLFRIKRSRVPQAEAAYYFHRSKINSRKIKDRINTFPVQQHQFWRYANYQIQKFRSTRSKNLLLYLKEIEFRFNYLDEFLERFIEKLSKFDGGSDDLFRQK